jgi:hypothetical protein
MHTVRFVCSTTAAGVFVCVAFRRCRAVTRDDVAVGKRFPIAPCPTPEGFARARGPMGSK